MSNPKFDPKELKIVGEIPGFFPGMPSTPLFDFPVTRREAYIATMKRKPVWAITNIETGMFLPKLYPDNVARAFTFEANPITREQFGGKDIFGIDWIYIDTAGGSMVKPGSPFLKDANEWKEKLKWPDVDSWDWEGSSKANKEYLNNTTYNLTWIMNGYFERLISFMDFEGAAIALIDEEQQDAVKEIFQKLTDLYIKIVDKFIEYFPQVSGFTVHDDWGSQIEPFFSPAICEEMLVPAMRRLTDYIHSKGLYADFHCCGHVERQVPNMIAAGWDSWSGMAMNDTQMLYEKYGDKIIIGVIPDQFDPMTTSEADQRAAAAKYVEKFCKPGKPSILNFYGAPVLTPAFREELYKLSRIKYSETESIG
ncbi:uroporphyrinogen decarboxylase (URO-D) [Oxobacter pfennigii]|uniref:Uroporphyrinogen decarboxylase (URO-D) n=1 Tax=Oxobacter pfennigii TaxID=36849 RepID=A0A0P8YBI2_9CLOT|nr:uroporphyrinogen decarboxylase family protein [Oxobacter pfennigii]KPU44404.1 uroporphyrinogen decarboxylase (URO-D) [Oxobacter pfennigii]